MSDLTSYQSGTLQTLLYAYNTDNSSVNLLHYNNLTTECINNTNVSDTRFSIPLLKKGNGYLVAPRALDYLMSGLCEQKENPPEHSHWHSAVAKLCGRLNENIWVKFTRDNSEIVINNSNTSVNLRALYKTDISHACSYRNKERHNSKS